MINMPSEVSGYSPGAYSTNPDILALILAWKSKVWDKFTYLFSNFSDCAIEVWEWKSNFTPHFMIQVNTYHILIYI